MVQRLLERRLIEMIRIVQAVPATVALRSREVDHTTQYLHFEDMLMQIGDAAFAAVSALRQLRTEDVDPSPKV